MLAGMPKTVDVVVLGLGVGGEAVAGGLAEAGLDVVGVESTLVGGECPYWGCIPSKMMVRSAGLLAEARRIEGMAGDATVRPDYGPVAQRIREEATADWDDAAAVERLEGKGAAVVRGVGRLTGPGEVTVDGQVFRARRAVVLGTGTKPSIPPIPGLADTPYWTNRDAIEAKVPPISLLVIGGGAIGLELAQAFARFGTEVTVVEAAPRILAVEEPEASELLAEVLPGDGITLRAAAEISEVRHDGTAFTVVVDGDELTGEELLVATGRRADLARTGFGRRRCRCIGPLCRGGRPPAGHRWNLGSGRSHRQGRVHARRDVPGRDRRPLHSRPGRSGRRLQRTATGDVYRPRSRRRRNDRAAGARIRPPRPPRDDPDSGVDAGVDHKAGNEGFIKLVEDADKGVLLGATSAGPAGGEVLGALAVAVHAKVSTQSLRQMIYAYPTFHRAIEEALKIWGKRQQSRAGEHRDRLTAGL
jgi:pyruvate/2-oxoglutarate dehydrogenase complex dihydrolipoamide dehydrogenase (E3) component